MSSSGAPESDLLSPIIPSSNPNPNLSGSAEPINIPGAIDSSPTPGLRIDVNLPFGSISQASEVKSVSLSLAASALPDNVSTASPDLRFLIHPAVLAAASQSMGAANSGVATDLSSGNSGLDSGLINSDVRAAVAAFVTDNPAILDSNGNAVVQPAMQNQTPPATVVAQEDCIAKLRRQCVVL